MSKNIKIKILSNEKYKKTSKEYKLINYLNNDPQSIIDKPINLISKKLLFNTSTLTRIVRKIGFENYADFRKFIIIKTVENKKYSQLTTDQNHSDDLLTNSFIFNNLAIEETINAISKRKFEEIINEITFAKRILLFGIGFSHSICHQLTKYLVFNNIHCCNVSGIYHALRLVNCSSDDLWIIVSITLTTREIKFLLKELIIKNKNKIIVITSNETSNFLKKVNHIIKLKSAGNSEKEHFNFNYKVALTAIASLIINGVINKINHNKVKKILDFEEKLKKWKK